MIFLFNEGLFTYYVSHILGVLEPPPPFVSVCQQLAYPPSPFVSNVNIWLPHPQDGEAGGSKEKKEQDEQEEEKKGLIMICFIG